MNVVLTNSPRHLSNINSSGNNSGTGVEIAGDGHVVENYFVQRYLYGLKFDGGCDDVQIRKFGAKAIANAGYPLYMGTNLQGEWNARPVFDDASFEIEPGSGAQHAGRIYCVVRPTFNNLRFRHFGLYHGGSFIIKACRGEADPKDPAKVVCGTISNCKTWGRPPSLGPNRTDADQSFSCRDLVISDCTFDMNGDWRNAGYTAASVGDLASDFLSHWSEASPFVIQAGTFNITFLHCKFIQNNPNKAIIRCNGTDGVHPAPSGIVADTCAFHGGNKRIDGTFPAGVTLKNC